MKTIMRCPYKPTGMAKLKKVKTDNTVSVKIQSTGNWLHCCGVQNSTNNNNNNKIAVTSSKVEDIYSLTWQFHS